MGHRTKINIKQPKRDKELIREIIIICVGRGEPWCSAGGRTPAPHTTDGIKRKEDDVEILRQYIRNSARKLKTGCKSICDKTDLRTTKSSCRSRTSTEHTVTYANIYRQMFNNPYLTPVNGNSRPWLL